MPLEKDIMGEYLVKFYYGDKLMHKASVYAYSSKEAVSIALNEVKGVYSFDRINVIHSNE